MKAKIEKTWKEITSGFNCVYVTPFTNSLRLRNSVY